MPRLLGSNVSLDASSNWHTSALVLSALESVTLPSRLKGGTNSNTLSGITDLLNAMGKQRISSLQMNIAQKLTDASGDPSLRQASHRSYDNDDEESDALYLDIDFSPSDQVEPGRRQNGFHKPRIFSQFLTSRGATPVEGSEELSFDGEDRLRHRNPNRPVTRRYNSSLAFPLLDSFPKIFRGDDKEPLTEAIEVTASLTTEASVSDRLKLLRTTVMRSIGVEDRETLSNDLAEMAEEYHEGWSSGSDEGDDD